jgi:hypothetical protein
VVRHSHLFLDRVSIKKATTLNHAIIPFINPNKTSLIHQQIVSLHPTFIYFQGIADLNTLTRSLFQLLLSLLKMAEPSTSSAARPSSSVKLVLLGEAAVGKVSL